MKRVGCLTVVVGIVVLGLTATPAWPEDEEDLAELVARVGKTRWTDNNTIELLADPRRAWEARLDLLEAAESHVFLSTFSWYGDDRGIRFREALESVLRRQSKENDFRVYCLADAAAMGLRSRSFDELRKTGAVVRSFHRASWGLAPMFDARMHDKMVIEDGKRAIVGGRNYSDIYYDPQKWWLDFGVLVEGASVWDLQMIFLKEWTISTDLARAHHFAWPIETIERRIRSLWRTGRFPGGKSPLEPYLNERFFPVYETPPGSVKVAVLYDNPIVWKRAPTADLLLELVDRAEAEIDLMTPFPNFELELTEALVRAVERGVRVRLIVNDQAAALRVGPILKSSFPSLILLIEGGVEVWGWMANPKLLDEVASTDCAPAILPPVALHGKIVRIDSELTIVHSSNFNIRSAYYNTEAGVAVMDQGFNRRVEGVLDRLLTLRDFDLACTNGDRQLMVDKLVNRLDAEDVEDMRQKLGARQFFLDGMSLLW